MSKKKKHKLLVNEEADFALLGIVTAENDYRLSWILNNKMQWQLEKQENILIQKKKVPAPVLAFSNFFFEDPDSLISFTLIKNQDKLQNFLLDDQKGFDYLLMIQGDHTLEVELQNIQDQIRNINVISTASYIDIQKLKNPEFLHF
jgi:hypothetical protein